MKRRVCVLVSGGFDSAVLTAELLARGREVYPLYVRCGFVWEKAELSRLRRFLQSLRGPGLKPLAVLDMPMKALLGRHWGMTGRGIPGRKASCPSVAIPGRNFVLLSAAALFSARRKIPEAVIGVLKSNPFCDAAPRFLALMGRSASVALGFSWRASAPYARLTKRQVVARARRMGVRTALTLSCMQPRRGRACGRCSKCEELRRAL